QPGRRAARQGDHALAGLQSGLWRPQSVASVHLRFAFVAGDLYQRTRLRAAVNARLAAIIAFRLTTTDPERLARFYESIGFSVAQAIPVPRADVALLGLTGGGTRIALTIGEQRIELEGFDRKGRPYPENATAADLCFQHFALVTPDAAAAWERARTHGATPISTGGPVTLTASAGGLTAVKFRDPEGHPLEFVQFPAALEGSRRSEWLSGIDHSAISVADADASRG